jgi:GntR family transcriptional regulator of arabinose operon
VTNYKYQAIVDWAKQYLREKSFASGDKFLSEAELCELHGASRQTVRQALAVLERQNVIWRKRGSGTFVQSPRHYNVKQTLTVGVVTTYFSDYIFPDIVTGIERELTKNNVAMQLITTHNHTFDEANALQSLILQDIDGLIVEPSKSALPNPNVALYDEIKSRNVPLVFFNARYPWSNLPLVAIDDAEAGRVTTEYLLSLGHEEIYGFFVFDDIQGHLRYKGFTEALISHGIHLAEERALWYSTRDTDIFFSELAARVKSVLEKATAIVCYNDKLAVSMLDVCKKMGVRVPEDISIVGIDDSNLASICEVPLTTVVHPKQALGKKTAEMVLSMIRGVELSIDDYLYRPKLVIRDSTARPSDKTSRN